MVNEQLLSYVKGQLSLNISREIIAANLKGSGWTDADINEAFSAITPSATPSSVPVSPLSSSQVFQNASPVSKHKKILPVVVILILLGLAGGAATYAYQKGVFVSLPKLLTDSFSKVETAKTYRHNFSFSIDFSGLKDLAPNPLSSFGLAPKEIKFSMYGASDMTDKNNLKTSSVISINMNPISVAAEMRLVGDTLYARLTQPPTPLAILPIPMLSEYKDKWFSVSKETMAGLPSAGVSQKYKLTAEQEEHINKLLRDANIIKPISKLSTETIDGQSAYHFSFDIDRVAFISFIESTAKYISEVTGDKTEFSSFDSKSLSLALDAVKDFKGEIWIGRNDKLMRKATVSFGILPDRTKDEQVKVSAVALMSNWNEPISIVAPAESTPFQTLIEGSLGDVRQKGKEASIKATLSTMRAQAELFYDVGNSYAGFCSSPELKVSRKYIEDQGGTEFICRNVVKSYVVSTKLSSNSDYWCVDSTGVSKSTVVSPSGIACP